MHQMQSSQDGANAASIDQKITTVTTVPIVENPGAINTSNREQQSSGTKEDRLDKSVVRLSSQGTVLQAVLTIPTFVVELNNGIAYANQCPIQPLINVFLIVHGCSSLANGIVLIMGFIAAKYIKRSSTPSPCARLSVAASLIGQLVLLIFSVAWLIAGQVWVFGAQSNGFQSTNATQSATYCHPTVFWTGFAIIIITYAIWLIIFLVVLVQYIKKRHKIKQKTILTPDDRN